MLVEMQAAGSLEESHSLKVLRMAKFQWTPVKSQIVYLSTLS